MRISLQKAKINDSDFFFTLKTEKHSQENSLAKKKITHNEHKEWFKKKIKNKNNVYLVVKKKLERVAIVRYDLDNFVAQTSIIVAKPYRNLGLGTKILKKSEKFIKQKLILISKIRKANKSSFKIFTSNGYKVLTLSKKIYTLYKAS